MPRLPSEEGTVFCVNFRNTPLFGSKELLKDDLATVGKHLSFKTGLHLEYYDPEDFRSGCPPNMIIDITDDDLLVCDLGGHNGKLLKESGHPTAIKLALYHRWILVEPQRTRRTQR